MSQQIPERIPGGAMDLSHLAPGSRGEQGAPGQTGQPAQAGQPAQTVDMPSVVLSLDDQGFEQVMQLSNVVPVVIELTQPGRAPESVLEQVVKQFKGKIVLAKVDIDANPGLAQAFQVQSVPTVVGMVAGRPVPLFQGSAPEQQVREVFEQLSQLATQQGVVGRVNAPDLEGVAGNDGEGSEQTEAVAPVNPAHESALEALERGDYTAAVEAYEHVLLKAPADHEARAALVQVRLLHRLEGTNADDVRRAAADAPDDIEAQLRVADLDVSGGHIDDAFGRLLELFVATSDDGEKTRVRERLVELFETVGTADPRVASARARLANLLY